MAWLLAPLVAIFAEAADVGPGAHSVPARVSGLVTPQKVAKVAPSPIYGQRPLTVECYARMNSRAAYNILLSYEPKNSCGHWELFTMPKSCLLYTSPSPRD